jgi:hypothetical protein
MSDDTLPPLPHEGLLSWQTTADEMRAYGQACADAAIERCAQRDAQAAEIERQREVIAKVNARCDHLGMRLGEVIRDRDALRAASIRARNDIQMLHMVQSINNQNLPSAWHDAVDAALEAIDAARAQETKDE